MSGTAVATRGAAQATQAAARTTRKGWLESLKDEAVSFVKGDNNAPWAILAETVRSRGMGLVLVEQNIEMALGLTERVDFIEGGRIVASVPAEALRRDKSLIEEYMAL